jgi:hypothetical protein
VLIQYATSKFNLNVFRSKHHKTYSLVDAFFVCEGSLSEIRKAIAVFHYAEKIKSNLILTASLLDFLSSAKKEEIAGAEKLIVVYFNALIREVSIAANASEVQGFKDVNTKLEQAIKQTEQHNYANAVKLVSEAISIATTSGNQAAETLKAKGLI